MKLIDDFNYHAGEFLRFCVDLTRFIITTLKNNRSKQALEESKPTADDFQPAVRFTDGITEEEFSSIMHKVQKRVRRVKQLYSRGADVYGTVESQSGISEWDFTLDYNDEGYITGGFRIYSGNYDSGIPRRVGRLIAEEISAIKEQNKYRTIIKKDMPMQYRFNADNTITLRVIDDPKVYYQWQQLNNNRWEDLEYETDNIFTTKKTADQLYGKSFRCLIKIDTEYFASKEFIV